MADAKKLAKQWLETDAAFGVTEVPIARKPRQAKAAAKAAAPKAVAPAAPPARRFEPQSAPPPIPIKTKPAPEPGRFSLAEGRPAPAVRIPKAAATVEIPGAPEGALSSAASLSRGEKEKALAALAATACKELGCYFDEVATKVVFGEGDVDAPIMFIGEGPGAEEDRTGRPFVGKAGQMLDKWITAMGFAREQVYIANVVKLRAASPSEEWGGRLKDRPPTPEEVARNIGYLHKQIEIIRPKAIVTLGAPALKYVTASKEGITRIRGTWLSYRGTPVMPTFHPAYVLRNYTDDTRRKVWDDLLSVMAKLGIKRAK